jgi:hypothetical protein
MECCWASCTRGYMVAEHANQSATRDVAGRIRLSLICWLLKDRHKLYTKAQIVQALLSPHLSEEQNASGAIKMPLMDSYIPRRVRLMYVYVHGLPTQLGR